MPTKSAPEMSEGRMKRWPGSGRIARHTCAQQFVVWAASNSIRIPYTVSFNTDPYNGLSRSPYDRLKTGQYNPLSSPLYPGITHSNAFLVTASYVYETGLWLYAYSTCPHAACSASIGCSCSICNGSCLLECRCQVCTPCKNSHRGSMQVSDFWPCQSWSVGW